MKRSVRVVLNVTSALSVLFLVATVVFLVRSYRVATSVGRSRPGGSAGVVFDGGRLIVSWAPSVDRGGSRGRENGWFYHTWPATLNRGQYLMTAWVESPVSGSGPRLGSSLGQVVITNRQRGFGQSAYTTVWKWGGFRYELSLIVYPDQTGNLRSRRLLVPTWGVLVLVGLFAAVPVARVRAGWVRRRARQRGLCASCGYDLRATPDRCPECGAATACGASSP